LRRSAPAGRAGALELAARDTAREADYARGAPEARGAATANGAAPPAGSAHRLQERDTAHEGEYAEGAAAATNGHAAAEYGGPVKHGMTPPTATNGAKPALPSPLAGCGQEGLLLRTGPTSRAAARRGVHVWCGARESCASCRMCSLWRRAGEQCAACGGAGGLLPPGASRRRSSDARRASASRRRSMDGLGELVAASRRAESGLLPGGAVARRGMSLPFTPLCLTFRELSYYVPLPKARRLPSQSVLLLDWL